MQKGPSTQLASSYGRKVTGPGRPVVVSTVVLVVLVVEGATAVGSTVSAVEAGPVVGTPVVVVLVPVPVVAAVVEALAPSLTSAPSKPGFGRRHPHRTRTDRCATRGLTR
ncbi:hypothetical protein OV079_09190 [Nannocystis pusilla]|uniref:Uncharacterized protein n=1 Tax=Nannocystis pusilla TaxID=889268 RepID=A0A9X3EL62_9BACT|nr:hypothetical protein [Nannocystis pusilla]MCY1005735.1 hypothetical protein [Nannocystis pusilla]